MFLIVNVICDAVPEDPQVASTDACMCNHSIVDSDTIDTGVAVPECYALTWGGTLGVSYISRRQSAHVNVQTKLTIRIAMCRGPHLGQTSAKAALCLCTSNRP